MKKYFLLIVISALLISCQKNYEIISIENEIKNGAKLEEIVRAGNAQFVAVLNTNFGKIEFEMFPVEAPKAVTNFIGLTLQGYYNGLTFHRVVKNFMIQGGDSTGTGMGGRSYFGREFEDEFSDKLSHNEPGIVSLANSGPDSNTSQFFIITVPTLFLDRKHTIFGKVISGMDVVYEIGKLNTDRMEKPLQKVIMESVSVEKRVFK